MCGMPTVRGVAAHGDIALHLVGRCKWLHRRKRSRVGLLGQSSTSAAGFSREADLDRQLAQSRARRRDHTVIHRWRTAALCVSLIVIHSGSMPHRPVPARRRDLIERARRLVRHPHHHEAVRQVSSRRKQPLVLRRCPDVCRVASSCLSCAARRFDVAAFRARARRRPAPEGGRDSADGVCRILACAGPPGNARRSAACYSGSGLDIRGGTNGLVGPTIVVVQCVRAKAPYKAHLTPKIRLGNSTISCTHLGDHHLGNRIGMYKAEIAEPV